MEGENTSEGPQKTFSKFMTSFLKVIETSIFTNYFIVRITS